MSTGEVAAALWRRLQGKSAIITGGSGGIGEATVRLFASHGAQVIIADIADDAGMKLANSLSPWATYVHCDVTKEEDVSATVDLAMEKHGKLDIMYNNAGTIGKPTMRLTEDDMEDYERVMNIDVKGVMQGIKHAARVMIPKRKGSIISTARITGIVGGLAPYSYTVSKHAIIGLTKNGAAELGKSGIRVNCISPTIVATDLLLKYMGVSPSAEAREKVEAMAQGVSPLEGASLKAEDVAQAALYLASEDSKYVSGHNIVLDGGVTVIRDESAVFGKE